MTPLRIGQGYDVHRLVEGRKLILGGVDVPWEKGLLGHSDADVLTHAVMDALAGAAKLGDIGKLFPDTDPAYAGISSLKLLAEVGRLLAETGRAVVNIDATLLAQAPKVGPYRQQMAENIAMALHIDPERVNVKATTEEGLGFTGDGSGMAAQAIALIEREYPRLTRTDALSSGKLIVAIMSAGHFTSSGHFIVLRGVQDEKILVADPASRTRSEQSWDLSIILNEASKAAGSGGPFWIIG